MTEAQADILIFLAGVFGLAHIVIGWVIIDFCRRVLDALNAFLLRTSERREWGRERE